MRKRERAIHRPPRAAPRAQREPARPPPRKREPAARAQREPAVRTLSASLRAQREPARSARARRPRAHREPAARAQREPAARAQCEPAACAQCEPSSAPGTRHRLLRTQHSCCQMSWKRTLACSSTLSASSLCCGPPFWQSGHMPLHVRHQYHSLRCSGSLTTTPGTEALRQWCSNVARATLRFSPARQKQANTMLGHATAALGLAAAASAP